MRRRAPGSATECWRARQAFCSDKYCPSRRFLRGGRHPMLEIEVGIPTSILVSCDHSPGPRLEIEARGSNLARAYSNCRSMVISDSRWWVPPFGDHEARRTLTPKASPSCDAIRDHQKNLLRSAAQSAQARLISGFSVHERGEPRLFVEARPHPAD